MRRVIGIAVVSGARGRNRTVTPLSGPGILSPVRLPVSPPGLRSATTEVYRTYCVLVFLSISNPMMLVSLLVSLERAGSTGSAISRSTAASL